MLSARDLADIAKPDDYTHQFRALCRSAVASPKATYVLMERYAHVNGFAGSAVALLAGNIGYERHLFGDRNGGSNPDRGMKIAAKVFMATIDEHGGMRGLGPHRSMAQACVDKVADYASLDQPARVPLDAKSAPFLAIVDRFKANYAAFDRKPATLVRAIGYHIASEYFADLEYQILDEELWHKNVHGKFREVVHRTRTENGWGGPWGWITVHGHYGEAENDDGHGVEEEHFQGALDAARFLEKYTPAGLTSAETRTLLTEGVLAFRDDFLRLFDLLASEVETILDNEREAKSSCNGHDACASDACSPDETAGDQREIEAPAAA